jgi:hypothetical protein
MKSQSHVRSLPIGIALLYCFFVGCNQGDDPKIATAPPPPKVEDAGTQKNTKDAREKYQDKPKYEKAMERRIGKGNG